MQLRSMKQEEQKYAYRQSSQLIGQCGSIGYLRGDFGSSGNDFSTTWFDLVARYKTDEFDPEFDSIINNLRQDLLSSRDGITAFCQQHPSSSFQGNLNTEYGFRIDSKEYSYLIRCNPSQEDYDFYVFPYVTNWLDMHIARAAQGIRFIDSQYNELFRVADGAKIIIAYPDGKKKAAVCRFIDECHTEIGNNLYHICEFAQRMEQVGGRYEPNPAEPARRGRQEEKMMKVLMMEPGKAAYAAEIEDKLKSMQQVVGGDIEAVYPYEDAVALVCNEEGKLEGLPLNRALRDETGQIYDIISGPFFICGLNEESFGSLPPELMAKYKELFYEPEAFLRIDGAIHAKKIPVSPQLTSPVKDRPKKKDDIER